MCDGRFGPLNSFRWRCEAINASGEAMLSHTKLHDEYVMRVSIGQSGTRLEHVHALFERLGRC